MLATDLNGEAWSAHVPRPDEECRNYEHGFDVWPVAVDELCGEMAAWARGIGWVPGPASNIKDLLLYDQYATEHDPAVETMDAADVVFELLLALGLPEIPQSLPRRLEPRALPFRLIASPIGGLGAMAHSEWAYHTAREEDGEALEPLAERKLHAAALSQPPPATIEVGGRVVASPRHLGELMHSQLVGEYLTPLHPNGDDYRYGRHPMPQR